jgi:hypothetical protein
MKGSPANTVPVRDLSRALSPNKHLPVGSSTNSYYTAVPTTTFRPVQATTTWADSCVACTLVGGVADYATCTTVRGSQPPATATASVYLAVNNSVSVGTANNQNGTFLHNVYGNLTKLCTGQYTGAYCNAEKHAATMENIMAVNKEAVDTIELGFTIPFSVIQNATMAQKMLAQGVAAWQQAVSQKCSNVTYELEVTDDEPCDKIPPLGQRDLATVADIRSKGLEPLLTRRGIEVQENCDRLLGSAAEPREPGCVVPTPRNCSLTTRLCSGPDSFGEYICLPSRRGFLDKDRG